MTHRLQPGSKLVVASHNPGKAWEIHQLVAPFGLEAISAATLNLAEPEETEISFAGNARLKAVAAATATGLPALADDSGLEVAALGGAPGIFSARWAGPSKDFSVAMRKVAEELTERDAWSTPGPQANFISVLCLAWPDGHNEVFEGKVHGHLVWPPRGGNGFGYDPMFQAEGQHVTFGEMEPEQKYAISHRTRAFAAFKSACLDGLPMREAKASRTVEIAGLQAAAANLSTQAELARFIANLEADVAANAESDASVVLVLQRVREWLDCKDHADEPKWRFMAKAMLAATGRV